MLDKLLARLRTPPATPDTVGDPFDRKQLAVAALLVEASHADRQVSDEERAAVVRVIRERFSLDPEAAQRLIELAEGEIAAALDDWVFTEAVRGGFSAEDREDVIGMLWEVVYADGRLAHFEDELVHRLARALDVSENAVEAKRVQAFARVGLDRTDGSE